MLLITFFLIGLFCGIVTGLISVGGGIIIIFSLLLIPPLTIGESLTMKEISNFSIMQTFFSSLSGTFFYIKEKLISQKVILLLGLPAFLGGVIGVNLAYFTPDFFLKIIFSILAVSSALMMLKPYNINNTSTFHFSKKTSFFSIIGGLVIGIIGGIIGVGAGFIFIPLYIYIYNLGLRKAVGTSIVTMLLLSSGSLFAKISITSLPLDSGLALIFGALIGTQIGGKLNKVSSVVVLKKIASIFIVLISIKIVYDLF